ncbi:hypothetical protein [Spongiactinospora sp. TRM90649]|uniref:hypothetical protein n=1 Tax=Spongiactinospora sp. TRM90649 TaxID=3031114 RepID=UPI0023F804F1|nr:hypothetical protein [Spongiactinospora sp. TRM90649]MDF5753685.1 hypothetical protein [Spongiactinospora sp. TRM90649]
MAHDDRDLTRATRRRMRRTGESYQTALAAVRVEREGGRVLRYDITGEMARFVQDEHGGDSGLLTRLDPAYTCPVCAAPGDARADTTGLRLQVAPYDPDLTPAATLIGVTRHHARCRPSDMVHVDVTAVPREPAVLVLPAAPTPEAEGRFALSARAVLAPGGVPALLLLAEVVEDFGTGPTPWLWNLELTVWRPAGFAAPSLARKTAPGWSARIVRGGPEDRTPGWAAIRTREPEYGRTPDHLFLGVVDIPGEWAEAARDRATLLLLAGPVVVAGDAPRIPREIGPDTPSDLLRDGHLLAAYTPLTMEDRSRGTR